MSIAAASTAAALVGEARDLVAGGWCQEAHARDELGREVPAWRPEAQAWSMLGALLASWHVHEKADRDEDIVAHLADAKALGDATEALGDVVGTTSLEHWNDEPGRTQAEVIDAFGRALRRLAGDY